MIIVLKQRLFADSQYQDEPNMKSPESSHQVQAQMTHGDGSNVENGAVMQLFKSTLVFLVHAPWRSLLIAVPAARELMLLEGA